MKTCDTRELEVQPHKPLILSSTDAARLIAIHLPAGEQLEEHKVHERAFLLVVAGDVELEDASGEVVTGGTGLLAEFEPQEEHEVRAKSDAQLLLFLAPWPGDGHPGAMSLDDKANARELARERADEAG
jgi:quercetin dioxygenase-like cupin family protein